MEPKIDPKWKKNGIQKQSDFKTMLAGRPTIAGTRNVARDGSLAPPTIRARYFLKRKKEGKDGRKEEDIRREQGKKGRMSRI